MPLAAVVCLATAAMTAAQAVDRPADAAPPRLLILHKLANSVGLYDSTDGRRLWTTAVGVKPHEMVVTADEELAFVTDYGVDSYTDVADGGNTISIVNLRTGALAGRITLGGFRRPHGIARGLSGRLYVTVDRPAAVLEVDPVGRRVAREHRLDQTLPHMVVISRDEQTLFVANSGSGTVSLVDRHDGRQRTVFVGGTPMGLALARDGRRLYVATRDGNAVVVIDPAARAAAGRIELPGEPARVRLTPDDRRLLVTLMRSGELVAVDTATGQVAARVSIGAGAEGIGLDHRYGFGYASAQRENRVVKFSLGDYRPVLAIQTDDRPDPIEILRYPRRP